MKKQKTPEEKQRIRLGKAVLRAGADPVKRAKAMAKRTAFINKHWPDEDTSTYNSRNGL